MVRIAFAAWESDGAGRRDAALIGWWGRSVQVLRRWRVASGTVCWGRGVSLCCGVSNDDFAAERLHAAALGHVVVVPTGITLKSATGRASFSTVCRRRHPGAPASRTHPFPAILAQRATSNRAGAAPAAEPKATDAGWTGERRPGRGGRCGSNPGAPFEHASTPRARAQEPSEPTPTPAGRPRGPGHPINTRTERDGKRPTGPSPTHSR